MNDLANSEGCHGEVVPSQLQGRDTHNKGNQTIQEDTDQDTEPNVVPELGRQDA